MHKVNILKYKKIIFTIFTATLLGIVLILFNACQKNQEQGNKLQVQDCTGKTFTFDKPINKIVSTHNPTLNYVVVLGNGTSKYIAGCGNKDKGDGLYSKLMTDWSQIPSINGNNQGINKEEVIKLKPDLALVPEQKLDVRQEDYKDTGVEVFGSIPNKEKIESVPSTLKMIANLFGENKRADNISKEFEKVINDKKDAFEKAENKPKVLFLGAEKYKIAVNNMIQTQIIEAAGGINASTDPDDKDAWKQVDAETILKKNPDVIYIPSYAKYSIDDILNDEKLKSINAVKNKKVYLFPCTLEPWDYPTCSICLGVCWAKNNLHPDLYSKDELLKNCNDFYKILYNKTFTTEELGLSWQ